MNIQILLPWAPGDARTPAAYEGAGRDPFLGLDRDMNRLFDDAFRTFGLPERMSGFAGGWPSLEVQGDEKEVRITAEVPGLKEKDVEILLADNVLTMRGEKRSETEHRERRWSERFSGRFERRIPLPGKVEADKVTARFDNGVLTVTLPKSPRARSNVRRIETGKSG